MIEETSLLHKVEQSALRDDNIHVVNILVYLLSAIVTLFTVYVVTLDALSKYPLFEKIITVKQLIK